MRLDKFLADCGIGTRSEVKKYIHWGRVTVNGKCVKSPEEKVELSDTICYNKEKLTYNEFYYYMLNKPAGVITATEDKNDRTVMDVLKKAGIKCPKFDELAPVGRLDKDTEGLLLITNDGDLAHKMISPKFHVDKLYFAETEGVMTQEDIKAFENGIKLSDFEAMPANLRILSSDDTGSKVHITIHEGKFHQVKRMVEAVGKKVIYLKRLEFGPLKLDHELKAGNYRALTPSEIRALELLK